jgi:Ribbon-helix-helix protein, copG family
MRYTNHMPKSSTKKRIGRPPTGHDPNFSIRLPKQLIAAIDKIAKETNGNRAETIRLLLAEAVAARRKSWPHLRPLCWMMLMSVDFPTFLRVAATIATADMLRWLQDPGRTVTTDKGRVTQGLDSRIAGVSNGRMRLSYVWLQKPRKTGNRRITPKAGPNDSCTPASNEGLCGAKANFQDHGWSRHRTVIWQKRRHDTYRIDLQQIADKRKRAYEAEKEGRALSVVIEVLKVIARRPNPANMIAVAEHYILEFGLGTAEISKRANETDDPDEQRNPEMEGVANQMVVITLNRFLAEIKNEHPDWYKGG